MKFTILDVTHQPSQKDKDHKRNIHTSDSDTYQYLDELLDKTFVTDYFMERSASTDSPHTNK